MGAIIIENKNITVIQKHQSKMKLLVFAWPYRLAQDCTGFNDGLNFVTLYFNYELVMNKKQITFEDVWESALQLSTQFYRTREHRKPCAA